MQKRGRNGGLRRRPRDAILSVAGVLVEMQKRGEKAADCASARGLCHRNICGGLARMGWVDFTDVRQESDQFTPAKTVQKRIWG